MERNVEQPGESVEEDAEQVAHDDWSRLDEPTTGLDTGEIETLIAVLTAQRDTGASILVVAHDVGFVIKVSDYVYVLAQGQLLVNGKPAQVQRDPKVIEAYLGRSA